MEERGHAVVFPPTFIVNMIHIRDFVCKFPALALTSRNRLKASETKRTLEFIA